MQANKVVPINSKQDILDEAGLWLARLERGLSDAESEQLAQWLAQSPAHQQAFKELCLMWDDMSVMEELSNLFPLADSPAEQPAIIGKVRNWPGMAHAAALLIACGAVFGYLSTQTLGDMTSHMAALAFWRADQVAIENNYVTPVGEQLTVTLADNSVVTLNTDSQLRVAYSTDERSIYLERGEAYFDVAHNLNRPFVVYADGNRVEAVGTAFNVEYGASGDFEVVVTAGKVKVETPKSILKALVSGDGAVRSYAGVGESVSIGKAQKHAISQRSDWEIDAELAWQKGMVVFESELLADALLELSRYTSQKFQIADEELADIRVGGYFNLGDIDGLLYSLRENFGIDSHRKGDHIILSRASLD